MLRNKADEVLIETDMPSKVLKRSRRRRVVNAALVGVVSVAVVAGGFVGANALLDTTPTTVPGGPVTTAPPPPAGPWRGLWPQDTRAEAEAAQAEVDAGSVDHDWQLDPQPLLYRYGQEIKGWERTFFITEPLGELEAKATIGSCAEQSSEAQGGACEFALVTIEQLLGEGEGKLWFVTAEEPGDPGAGGGDGGDTPEAYAVSAVQNFMDRRIEGANVDEYLTPDSESLYDSHQGGLYLYDGDEPGGEPQTNWVGWQMVSVTPREGGDTFDVLVRVERSGFEGSGGYFEETLYMGRGLNLNEQHVPQLVRSAEKTGGTPGEGTKQCQAGSATPVKDCARSFMQTRLDGAGSEFYMTEDARNLYDDPNNQLHLYGTPYADSGNFRFDNVEVIGTRKADANSYEVDVRLFVTAEGGPMTIFETLFIGPGRNANGELQDFVVRGAEGHYE
jgi:hypothetical protein